MHKSFRKIFSLIIAVSVVFGNFALANDEVKFTITEGADNEMCREMESILKEPENKDLLGISEFYQKKYNLIQPSFKTEANDQLIIPAKYTNFLLVKWQNVKFKELNKFINKDKIKVLRHHGKDLKIQVATIDFDENNKDIKVLKIQDGGKLICDINLAYELRDYQRSYGEGCSFVYYDGVAYQIYSATHIIINRLPSPKESRSFPEGVCTFTPKI